MGKERFMLNFRWWKYWRNYCKNNKRISLKRWLQENSSWNVEFPIIHRETQYQDKNKAWKFDKNMVRIEKIKFF